MGVSRQDNTGNTALMWANKNGLTSVQKKLLELGANPEHGEDDFDIVGGGTILSSNSSSDRIQI